jgi:hypothetical protein
MGFYRNFGNAPADDGNAEQRIFEERREQGSMCKMVQGSQTGMH